MNKFLGEILIELGFVDESQLKMALDEKNKTGSLLGDVLLGYRGAATDSHCHTERGKDT
jgi:uncharacterized protein YdbL (DUF1318 family)